MDDDKFDKNDPANTPHAFQSVAFSTMGHALSFRGPCKVCKRGSGHHVHYEHSIDSTPPRWVKGAPEPERHVFEPGNVSVEGVGSYCKSCGGLEGNGNVHVLPTEPEPDQTKQELAKTARRYKRERDEQTELVRELLAARSPSAHGVPDQINRPEHYTAHPSGIECIQITEHMSFTLGNVVKYVWRADLKGDAVADLEKAIWYLKRELARRNGKITKV